MTNTVGRFDFRVIGSRRERVDPAVRVLIKKWSEDEKVPCISANLMTEQEIDEHIDSLAADLEAVRQQAKAALAKAQGR